MFHHVHVPEINGVSEAPEDVCKIVITFSAKQGAKKTNVNNLQVLECLSIPIRCFMMAMDVLDSLAQSVIGGRIVESYNVQLTAIRYRTSITFFG